MLASDIISRVEYILNDLDNITYTEAELLLWITDGQRAIATDRPDSAQAIENLQLASGQSKQVLPAGQRLLSVVRNRAAGTGNGPHIRGPVDKKALDAFYTNQNSALDEYGEGVGSVITEYAYNPVHPEVFWVYPVPSSAFYIEVEVFKTPAAITDTSDTLEVKDEFSNALTMFVCHRALTKDVSNAQAMNKGSSFMAMYNSVLGKATQADINFAPQVVDK